jgi:hypothetical protein
MMLKLALDRQFDSQMMPASAAAPGTIGSRRFLAV